MYLLNPNPNPNPHYETKRLPATRGQQEDILNLSLVT